MMRKEVVITGLGVAAPNGVGRDEFLRALRRGESGIAEIEAFDTKGFDVHRGGEVKGLRADGDWGGAVPPRTRTSLLTFCAAHEAVADARLAGAYEPERVGVIVGTTSGESQLIERVDEAWALGRQDELPAELYAGFSSNLIASGVASAFGWAGPVLMLANACASGNFAVAHACALIEEGEADAVLAGGADSLTQVALAGFSRMHAVAPERCQPFDRGRKGMMVAEGAGIVVLEERRRAEARGARIYASVLGSGLSCDAFHLTAPDPAGMAAAMRRALEAAGLPPSAVDYVNAHGTGTPANDAAETRAIKAVFGERAYALPVSSIKSMTGHTLGAAGAIETVACCLAMEHGFVPPTINYEEPDPECDLDYVPNHARERRLGVVMNNSFAFGGNNACLILARG